MLPTKFQVSWLFGSEAEVKIWFLRLPPRRPSWIPIETILTIIDLQVTPIFPTKFQINWPFGSGKEAKIDFQDCRHGGHLGFPIGIILAVFDLQVTPLLPNKFQVNRPVGAWEEAKNRFLRWLPRRPSWIFDWNDFSYLWSTCNHDASYQVSSQLAFWFRHRSEKYIFKIPAIFDFRPDGFDLQVTLKAKYQTTIYPTGEQLSLYGRWDGLILSLLSYQFESFGFG